MTYVISAGLAGIAGICYAAYIGADEPQVGIAYELYAIAAAVLGGCVAARRRGDRHRRRHRVGRDEGDRQRDQHVPVDPQGSRRAFRKIWRLDPNWTYIIIGAVILIAVILDQVGAHRAGETADPPRRRGRRCGASDGDRARRARECGLTRGPSLPSGDFRGRGDAGTRSCYAGGTVTGLSRLALRGSRSHSRRGRICVRRSSKLRVGHG